MTGMSINSLSPRRTSESKSHILWSKQRHFSTLRHTSLTFFFTLANDTKIQNQAKRFFQYNSSDTSTSPSSGLFIIPSLFFSVVTIYSICTSFFHNLPIFLGFCCPQLFLSFSLVQTWQTCNNIKIIHIRASILFIASCLGPLYFCAESSVIIQAHLSTRKETQIS